MSSILSGEFLDIRVMALRKVPGYWNFNETCAGESADVFTSRPFDSQGGDIFGVPHHSPRSILDANANAVNAWDQREVLNGAANVVFADVYIWWGI